MAFIYKNRQGKSYYLHTGPKKGGGIQYFVSQSDEGELLDAIPEGFELHETPNAQVYLRRKKPALIAPEELACVQRVLDKRLKLSYKLEIRGEYLTIHEGTSSLGRLERLDGIFFASRIKELEEKFASYQPIMRFVLCDSKKRLFAPERFCFRGSVDDWISIGEPEIIDNLARKYLKHLGKDSIYELY